MTAGELVDVFEAGTAILTTTAQALGLYEVRISVGRSTFPTSHTYHAVGETSGRRTNDTGISI